MPQIYLTLGYGVPKDIFKNLNYQTYLGQVFNHVYADTITSRIRKSYLIFSGGKTDLVKPYRRSEAGEMIRLFKHLMTGSKLGPKIKNWQIIPEAKSLSTLENFIFSLKVLKKHQLTSGKITIFCEATRENRIKTISRKIFPKSFIIKVIPIDFDTSSNRYLDPKFIKETENKALKHDLWALKNPENMTKYHEAYTEKVKKFRQAGLKGHEQAVKEWWEQTLKDLI